MNIKRRTAVLLTHDDAALVSVSFPQTDMAVVDGLATRWAVDEHHWSHALRGRSTTHNNRARVLQILGDEHASAVLPEAWCKAQSMLTAHNDAYADFVHGVMQSRRTTVGPLLCIL